MQISDYFSDYASIRDNYYQLLTKEYKLCNSALNEKDKSRHLNLNIT